jgi:hypothetical protein
MKATLNGDGGLVKLLILSINLNISLLGRWLMSSLMLNEAKLCLVSSIRTAFILPSLIS